MNTTIVNLPKNRHKSISFYLIFFFLLSLIVSVDVIAYECIADSGSATGISNVSLCLQRKIEKITQQKDEVKELLEQEKSERIKNDKNILNQTNVLTNKKIDDAKTEVNTNINKAKNEAVVASSSYANNKHEQSIDYANKVSKQALKESIQYIETRENMIDDKTNRLINTEKNLRIKGDEETLINAKIYADKNDKKILSSAKEYTDISLNKEKKERQVENQKIEEKGKEYTNFIFQNEKKERIDDDNKTLKNANKYTDFKIIENNELIAADITSTRELLKHNSSLLSGEIIRTKRNNEDNLNRTQRDLSDNISKTQEESMNFANNLVNNEKKERANEDNRIQNFLTQYTNKKIDRFSENMNQKFSYFRQETHQQFREIKLKLQRLENHINAGIAGVAAIASIPYSASENFSFGMGVGNYQNGKAIAAGAQYKIADNANVRVNIAWDNTDNASVGAGMAIGW